MAMMIAMRGTTSGAVGDRAVSHNVPTTTYTELLGNIHVWHRYPRRRRTVDIVVDTLRPARMRIRMHIIGRQGYELPAPGITSWLPTHPLGYLMASFVRRRRLPFVRLSDRNSLQCAIGVLVHAKRNEGERFGIRPRMCFDVDTYLHIDTITASLVALTTTQ